MSANAAAQPAAPVTAPSSAPAQAADAPAASSPAPRVHDNTARAVAAAREAARQESQGAAGQPAAPASAPATPDKPAEPPKEGEKPPGDKPARPDTVTARIADLTRRGRELEAQARAEKARADQLSQALEEAKKGGALFEAVKAAFKTDPLGAFEQMGEKWSDIVARVAAGGLLPTPEQVAAAEKERIESERDARLKRLEEERENEKKLIAEREAEQQREGARAFVAKTLISPEKHPHLVEIATDAAEEALLQVEQALQAAHKAGRRPSPNPVDANESVALTTLALDGLNKYYSDLHRRISPKVPEAKPPEQSGAPGNTPAAPAAPAGTSETTASQQRRPVNTITNAVASESPTAAQPRRLDADEARARAIEAARRLPAL